MDIQKLENGIKERQQKLEILSKELKDKSEVYQYHKEEFARLTLLHAGKQKLPASYHSRKKTLTETREETEAIRDAIEMLQKELSRLEEQKNVISYFQQHSVRYTDAQKSCREAFDRIRESRLKEEVESVIRSVRSLVYGVQEVAQSFNRLSNGLQSKYSLNDALQGQLRELTEGETENRDEVAKTVGESMQSFTIFEDILSESDLEELKSVLDMAETWKKTIGGFQNPKDIVLGRRSLVVEEKRTKRVETYRAPVKQKVIMRPPSKTVTRVVFDPRKSNDFIGTQ